MKKWNKQIYDRSISWLDKCGRGIGFMCPNLQYKLKHFSLIDYILTNNYTITNWRVSLSQICHEWPNNIATHSCVARMSELQRYLASCTLQFGSNLTKIIFQGKHFIYFIVVGGWRHIFWSDTHYSISIRYTRNIVQLNSFLY